MNLSGGQKKLLELGRAMMTEPRLVLLDEPGAGVNPTLLVKLRDMIRQLNRRRGYTFVIIEHDMDLIASLCERVIVLAEGSVLTEGPMDAVRQRPPGHRRLPRRRRGRRGDPWRLSGPCSSSTG